MNETTSPERTASDGEAPAPIASPGTLLRQARERAGLGVEDLAGQLKLAKGTLEALERDDFAALSEPVYVRGYYRKVAKVLPVSETELIAAYNARSKPNKAATPAMQRIPLAGGVAAGTSRKQGGPGIGLALAGVVIIAVMFLLADRRQPERLAESAPAVTTAPSSEAPALDAPAGAAPSAESGAATSGDAAPLTPAPAPTTAAAAPAPASAPAATTPAPASSAPAATTATPTTPAAVPAVPNQLVLDFSESSFVRVEDSRGRTLAIGLVRGGERQALDGQPPYTVFLGNAQNVKVHFGGQPVDFSSHINRQNDTARFIVP